MVRKKMMRSQQLLIALLILMLFPLVATSQVNVTHLGDSKAVLDKEGLIYSLPRTVINVSLVVNKIQKTKGPYAEFADKYLGLTTVITNNSTVYELKEISLTTTSEPDPEQFYFVEFDGKSSRKNKFIELNLSEAGFLQDVAAVSGFRNPRLSGGDNQPKPVNAFADVLKPSWTEHMDTVISKVRVDTTTIEQKVFRKITSEKNTEQKAGDAADMIIELDEDKLNLLSGDQEVGFGSNLAYMCSQLEAMKAKYLELFKGITSVTTTTVNFSFIPKPLETVQDATLCKFSRMNGVVGLSAPEGDPVTIALESKGLTSNISGNVKSKKSGDKNSHGFGYRLPDNAKIAVKVGEQTRVEAVFSINQLGVISFIPAKNLSSLFLHPESGNIKHIILK